jgi:hypothetical protein
MREWWAPFSPSAFFVGAKPAKTNETQHAIISMMIEASLEVLTDGSEHTGGPAIFLTLRRTNANRNLNHHETQACHMSTTTINDVHYQISSNEVEGSIVARYNLTGLPSLTGRLAADQSFKLLSEGAFKCVLLPSLNTGSTGGLAALFLSLVQAGYKVASPTCSFDAKAEYNRECSDSDSTIDEASATNNIQACKSAYGDVSIIGPQNTILLIDGILDTLFGYRRNRPSIRVCEIPSPVDDEAGCWWDVYQDEYIRVWGQSVVKRTVCKDCKSRCKKRGRE